MCHLITLCSLGHYVLIHLTYILSIWVIIMSSVLSLCAPPCFAGWLAYLCQSVLVSTCWRCDGETVEFDLLTTRLQRIICRFITGISMYQFIPWTYLSCSRSPLVSYRTTVTHMSLFSLRLSGENRPSLQSTTIHYVASVM